MGVHIHLEDPHETPVATINDIPDSNANTKVVEYKGVVYMFDRMFLNKGEVHLIFAETVVMKVNV